MFYRKEGLPEEGVLVLCTVTRIQYSSVFVNIDLYNNSGMIHISEIAAGRIRNIRDYVKEGKKVVCKVLRVNKQRGHVDLSLRRVSDNQRRNKVNEIKQEQKAESIIKYIAKQNKMPVDKLYNEISGKLLKDYEYLHHAFLDAVEGNFDLKKTIDKKYVDQLIEIVNQRFKPKDVEITGTFKISIYESDGIAILKKAFEKIKGNKGVSLKYLGGGRYSLSVKAKEYKEAEPILEESKKEVLQFIQENGGKAQFKRKE